jgi:hypothetical protein
MFRDAGFVDVTVLREFDYFANSPSLETRKVAGTFGARAIELTMRRGERPAHKALLLARRADPRRLFRAVERRGVTGLIALALALMACYGALAALALLSLLGVALTIHEAAWAGVIFLFAALTALAVAGGLRRHGSVGPLGLATLGAGLIAPNSSVSGFSLPRPSGTTVCGVAQRRNRSDIESTCVVKASMVRSSMRCAFTSTRDSRMLSLVGS